MFGGDLEIYLFGMIHENAQVVIRNVERYVLVGLLRESAAVLVIDVDNLTVPYEVPEPLTQAVDVLAHAEIQLFPHETAVSAVDVCQCALFGTRDRAAAPLKLVAVVFLVDEKRALAALYCDSLLILIGDETDVAGVQPEE